MEIRERWVLTACTTVLMSIASGISLHNIGTGICLGVCMGVAFGLFGSEDDDGE
ncbi:MAG: hypothetical protein J6D34_06585 [Atopobiaceae bacterium]|nr:hypothetical protein [Atopobiaceae bacterium]